jgi:DNA-directed RNA polymerase beta subunit
MIQINNGQEGPDDIDHLGNRRVKTVGELLQAKLVLASAEWSALCASVCRFAATRM